MKPRLLIAAALLAVGLPALAHDPSAHSRKPPAAPAECAAFQGKDAKTLNLKDPTVKAAFDQCEAANKEAKRATDSAAQAEHEH